MWPFPSVLRLAGPELELEGCVIADEGFDVACSRSARSFSSSNLFFDFVEVFVRPARSLRRDMRASLSYLNSIRLV